MKKILLMVMVAIILSIFISLHENYIAHALEPPLPIRMDKHDYVNTETAHFDMSGPPQSILKLDITRASDNRTFSYTVVTDSDGLAAFSLNLQSYQSDIYSALVSHG